MTTAGPKNPSSVSATGWSNPTFVYTDNGNSTSFGHNNGDTSGALDVSSYGFSIPAGATINGVSVTVKRRRSGGLDNVRDSMIKLLNSGSEIGNNKADTSTNWTTSDVAITYGGATDLWNATLTPAIINGSGWGVRFKSKSTGFTAMTALVDHIGMTVYYTVANVAYRRTRYGLGTRTGSRQAG